MKKKREIKQIITAWQATFIKGEILSPRFRGVYMLANTSLIAGGNIVSPISKVLLMKWKIKQPIGHDSQP